MSSSFAASSWITSVCWRWHSESLLINLNVLLGHDQRGLRISAKKHICTQRKAAPYTATRPEKGSHSAAVSEAIAPQSRPTEPNTVVGQLSEAFWWSSDGDSAWNRHQKHPQLTFYQMQTKKMSLWFVFLLLKLTSSPRFQIAATFLPLCAGSPPPPFVFHHHLIVILSCLHVGAIIELRTLWNDFAKKWLKSACWRIGVLICPATVSQLFKNSLIGVRFKPGYTPAPPILGTSSDVSLCNHHCAGERSVSLQLQMNCGIVVVSCWTCEPLMQIHCGSASWIHTQTLVLVFRVLLKDKCGALWIATICPPVISVDSLCEYINTSCREV